MDHSIRSASWLLEKGILIVPRVSASRSRQDICDFLFNKFVRWPFLNYMEHARYLSSVHNPIYVGHQVLSEILQFTFSSCKICFVNNLLNNQTIILLNLAEYCLVQTIFHAISQNNSSFIVFLVLNVEMFSITFSCAEEQGAEKYVKQIACSKENIDPSKSALHVVETNKIYVYLLRSKCGKTTEMLWVS